MTLNERHKAQLQASAISERVIGERGYWTADDRSEWARRDGQMADYQVSLPGLGIPIYRLGEPYTMVLRPDRPRTKTKEDGKESTMKYEWPAGMPLCFDILPRHKNSLNDTNIDIAFTEGTKKADALDSLGKSIIPVSLNGVWGWRTKNADGISKPIADFDRIAWKGRRVWLCFDSDYATNKNVQYALKALTEELCKRGAVVYILTWPTEHKGVDDAIAAGWTWDDLTANAKPHQADTATPAPFSLLFGDAIDAIPAPRFLIKDVLTMAETTVIAGAGDSGKTTIVTDIAFRVAQHAPVVYIAAEDASGIKQRRGAWMQHHKRSVDNIAILGNGNGVPCAVQLMDANQVSALIDTLTQAQPALVVVDTLSQCSSGADENGNDMTKLAAACNRIAHETGAAVIVIHHTTKDGKHYRGHSSLKDNTYGFHYVEKDDDYILLERHRVKNTGGEYRRRFAMLVLTLGHDADGDPITSTVPVPAAKLARSDALTPNERRILEMIALAQDADDKLTNSGLKKQAEKDLGIKDATVNRALKKLRELQLISPKGEKALSITDTGRAALAANTNTEDGAHLADDGGDMWLINQNAIKRVSQSGDTNPDTDPDTDPPSGASYRPQVSQVSEAEYRTTTANTQKGVIGVKQVSDTNDTVGKSGVTRCQSLKTDTVAPMPDTTLETSCEDVSCNAEEMRSIPIRRRVESASESAKPEAAEPRLPEGPLGLPAGWKEAWTASKAHIQARNPDLELRTGAHPRTRSGLQELLRDIEKLEAEHALARRE
jgi:DNA-binding MarR family transcriptional regulator